MSERGVRGVWCVVWARGGGSRTGADFVPKEKKQRRRRRRVVCVVCYLFIGLDDNQFVYIFQLHTQSERKSERARVYARARAGEFILLSVLFYLP